MSLLKVEPLLSEASWQMYGVVLCYAIAIYGSGFVVRAALRWSGATLPSGRAARVGQVIGKCENIIAITCILANQITGLALIFAAKSLVRNADKDTKDDYYLCGTLVNLVWSLILGFLAKILVLGL